MTPKHFAVLAVAAVVSAVAAIAVYSSSVEWSTTTQSGEPLFAGLANKIDSVETIEVAQGDETLTLKREDERWVLSEHDSFPATPEKVRGLLAGLSQAELVEPKTRQENRYDLLGVEDPTADEAASHLVRLVNADGDEVAAVIVGNVRRDESGMGTSGTYVRRPGDAQAWLADASVNAGVAFSDWVDPQLFQARKEDVKRLTVRLPGEAPLEIKRADDKRGHTLADIPEGMKLKYINIVDEIVRAARTVEFSDARKMGSPVGDAKASTVVVELEGGLTATYTIKQEGDVAWLSLEASGEGESEKIADALMTRSEGWEFRVPQSRVEEILKRREELLKDVSS